MIKKESALSELQKELIINCQELTSDTFLLECIIQYSKETFPTSGRYDADDYGLALYRVVNYTEQHSKEIITISKAIMNLLCKENSQHSSNNNEFWGGV